MLLNAIMLAEETVVAVVDAAPAVLEGTVEVAGEAVAVTAAATGTAMGSMRAVAAAGAEFVQENPILCLSTVVGVVATGYVAKRLYGRYFNKPVVVAPIIAVPPFDEVQPS